jgi:hypothetical protein
LDVMGCHAECEAKKMPYIIYEIDMSETEMEVAIGAPMNLKKLEYKTYARWHTTELTQV